MTKSNTIIVRLNRFFLIFILLFINYWALAQTNSYPAHIGDISFDPALDDPSFKVCNSDSVYQYYNFGKGLQYEGEKPKIVAHFHQHYKKNDRWNDSGYLTIRFIVNCEGKAGLFRIQEMDDKYKPKIFNKGLVNQILTLIKQLNGWIPELRSSVGVDYYQYLTFKMVNGNIIEILP